MKYANDSNSGLTLFPDGSIIWSLSADKKYNEVNVIYNQQMEGPGGKFQSRDNTSYYFLPLNAVEDYHYQFPDKSFEILKYIDKNEE